jgi:formylglycine-generating enzyme required for sulfatase activity
MKTKIAQWTIGSVSLIVLALAFASCNAIADTSGLIQTPDTVWIQLTSAKAVLEGGTLTAKLTLDFSKEIDGLTDDLNADALAKTFTFEYKGSTESGIAATGVKKTVAGIYTLSVKNVPDDDEGIVLVTINKSGIAPATRLWALNGEVVSDADSDTRRTLNDGAGAGVAAAETTADVTFTNASGIPLSAADFAVSTGGAISAASVSSDTATVTVIFASNTTAADKTYTVSIAADSTVIKGSATVDITQGAFSGTGGEGTSVSIGGIPAFNMRYVPPTPAGGFQRDGTAANMTIITRGYWMGETELTQELFEAVMGANPSCFSDSPADGETQAKRPVEQVNWYDAIAFCNKLSLLEGRTPVYSVSGIADWAELTYSSIPGSDDATWNAAAINDNADGYRLPTEMEWMWACIGATAGGADVTTTGYLKGYAGSTEGSSQTNLSDYAWYAGNAGDKTHEAGKKAANELGIYDMSGNVFEWCRDWYDFYAWYDFSLSGTQTDYTGAVSGVARVARGGSWLPPSVDALRSAYPVSDSPSSRYSNVSFRLVRP